MRTRPTVSVIAAALILTGCSSPDPHPSTPSPVVTPTAGATAAPTASWSTSTMPASSSAWDNPSAGEDSWPAPTASRDPRSANPTGKAGVARGMAASPSPDLGNATAVATAFVATAWSYDTVLDQTPSDAGRRAAVFATRDLAQGLREARTVAAPGQWWDEMASHRGYSTTQITEGGLGEGPSDSPTLAQRALTVTATPRGDAAWVGQPLPPVTLIITCGRASADQPWKVSAMKVVS